MPRSAFGTAQQSRPIRDRHTRAVLRDLDGDVGIGTMAATLAPHNEPDVRGGAWASVGSE
jgi:hypothetical protein